MIGSATRRANRTGSDKFARAAETLREELAAKHPGVEVRLEPLARKGDFLAALARIAGEGKQLAELHFLGHSGMYGIMFGSVGWPEQFSPHEWRQMQIPVRARRPRLFPRLPDGAVVRAVLRAHLRRARVRASRLHHRLDLSRSVHLEPLRLGGAGPLYLIACPGKRSHGLPGALTKYLGARAVPMEAYAPEETGGDASYDAVAALYDRAFADIRVRRDEWRWLNARLDLAAFPGGRPRLLDIGCGTGALLRALAGRIATGAGVDTSAKMIEQAAARAEGSDQLRFQKIDGPALPFASGCSSIW